MNKLSSGRNWRLISLQDLSISKPLSRMILAVVMTVILLAPAVATAQAKLGTVLVLAREKSMDMEYFIKNEVTMMIEGVKKAGYEVRVATPSGKSIEVGSARLESNLKLSDVQVQDYVAILIPCMGAGDYAVPQECLRIVQDADLKGIEIAAQHSSEVLAPAGLTKTYKIAYAPGVVIDRNLITSYNCPYTALSNHRPVDTENLVAALVLELSKRQENQ
jgi:putative intracellular protease/amidase